MIERGLENSLYLVREPLFFGTIYYEMYTCVNYNTEKEFTSVNYYVN